MNCTNKNFSNHNSPNYQDWLINTSYDWVEYISRNNKVIPSFSKDSEFYVKYEIDKLIKSMLPNDFESKDLTNLNKDLPFDTKAAYFQKVLYFGSNANLNDGLEEIFHASFQTMINKNQQKQLLVEGKSLINNFKKYSEEVIQKSPEIYNQFKTQEEKENRVVEEYIASKFVDFYNQDINTNNIFIDKIFKWLKDLFTNIFYNKTELESFFALIKDGYYKDKSLVSESSYVPATALIKHVGIIDNEIEILNLNANDSLTIIKQLSNLIYEAKRLNTFTKFKDVTKSRTGITKNEIDYILETGIKSLYEYYKENNDKKADALNFEMSNYSPELQEELEEDILLEYKNNLKQEVYKYIQDHLEENLDVDEYEDDEEIILSADTIGSDERGFDSISQFLKEYISTVGVPTGKFIKYKNFKPIEIKEIADPNTIYYALARGLKNTEDDFERFYKLKQLAYLPQNRFVKALYEKFILDITENNLLNRDDTKKFIASFNKKLDLIKDKNSDNIKSDLGITDSGLILFVDLIKGFDFWTKPSMIVTASLTEENEKNYIKNIQAFNPNQNSAEKSLMNISKEYYFRNNGFFNNKEVKYEIQTLYDLLINDVILTNIEFEEIVNSLHKVFLYSIDEDFTLAQSYLLTKRILKDKKGYENTEFEYPNNIDGVSNYAGLLDYSEVGLYHIKNIITGLNKDYNLGESESTLFDFNKGKLSNDLNAFYKAHAAISEKVQESTYKNADGKSIYLYQWRNASLVFFNKYFKTKNTVENLFNKILNQEQFPLLKQQEKFDNFMYMQNHYFIEKYMKDGKLSNDFKIGDFYAIEGIKDSTYTNETTFAGMTNNDFLLYRLLLTGKKQTNGLQPVFVNLMEAKKTALFIELPYIDHSEFKNYYQLFANEIQREKDRIIRETNKIIALLQKTNSGEGEHTLNLSNDSIKKIDQDFVYYEKYHPSKVTFTVDDKNNVTINKINGRAFEYSTSLKGLLTEEQFKTFENSELDINKIGANFNNYFNDILKHLKENDLIGLLSYQINKEGNLSEGFKKSLLSEFLNTIYINQLLSGDPATIVKNDVVDFNKRMASLNATIQTVYNNFTNESLGINEPVTELKIVTGTEPSFKSSFSNDKIDVADAQTYTTVKGMRRYLYGLNKLTKPLAEIMDSIENGIELTQEQINYMFENNIFLNVVKPVGYDGKHYIKTGMFMLTKEFTSHNGKAIPGMEFLDNLRVNMENNDIDMFMPQSASKMMVTNIFNTENFSTQNFDDFGSYSYTMSAKDFGQQLENPSGKQLIIDPSQQLEILMNEQNDKIEIYHKGEIKTILDIQQLYSSLLASRDEIMFNQAFNEISDEDFQIKYKDFLDKVRESLVDTGADPQTIDFFTPTDTGKKFNLNMAITKDKFAQLFFAHFTKGIIKQKVSGDALALVSSANVKVLKKVKKITDKNGKEIWTWEVIKKNSQEYNQVQDYTVLGNNLQYDENDDYNQLIDNGIDSELITKLKELGDGAYFYDELRSFKPKWIESEQGLTVQGYFAEALFPTWKKDLKIADEYKWMWGTRIPSQDKHSGLNIEWVDELPIYYGNTIITAKEIVQLSGADFDIDKLFLIKPELYFDKEKGKYVKYSDSNSEEQYYTYQYNYNKTLKKKVKAKLEANEQYQNILIYRNEIFNLLQNYDLRDSFENNEEVLKLRELIQQGDYILENKVKDINIKELKEDLTNIELKLKEIYDDLKSEIIDLRNIHSLELTKINSKINAIITNTIKETLEELNIPFNNQNTAVINNDFLELRQILNTNEHNINTLKTELVYSKIENKIKELDADVLLEEYNSINNKKRKSKEDKDRLEELDLLLENKNKDINKYNLIKELLNEYYNVNSNKIAISKTAVSQDYLKGIGDDTLENSTYYEIDNEGIPKLDADNKLIINKVFEEGEFQKTFPYSYHSFLGQIFNHKNTQTGKNNIGVAVNYNLLGIALNRLNVKLTQPIQIDDLELEEFGLLTYDNKRIFDIASMLVSAATDEAKDQQNAKYGLTVEALNIALPLLLLKTPPKIIILILQQPVVKEYLKLVSKKEQIFLSKKDLDNKFVPNNDLLKSIISQTLVPRVLTIKDLIEGKNSKNLNTNIQANVMNLISTIISINKEINPLNALIKLKKGYGSTLQEFDKLKLDADNLASLPTLYTNLYERFYTERENKNNLLQQYYNYEKQVIPLTHTLLSKHFLDYQNFVKQLSLYIDNQTRFYSSVKDRTEFNKKLLSFLYTYIWKDSYESQPDKINFFKNKIDTDKFVSDFVNLKKLFPQNLFLQRIRINKNELVFQTFVKLPTPVQLSIMDSFRELQYLTFYNPEYKEYKDFIKNLYLYHARKDGWLFKNNTLAKALPVEQFRSHSDSIDRWLDNQDNNDLLIQQLSYHFMQNFKNEGLYINKLLKPNLRNVDSKNFKLVNNKYIIDINKIEDTEKFVEELIKTKQDYVYKSKPMEIGGKVVYNKTLNPAYVLNINKELYELEKVYVKLGKFATEEYELTDITKLPLINNTQNAIITRVEYVKKTSKVSDTENELTNYFEIDNQLPLLNLREYLQDNTKIIYGRGGEAFVVESRKNGFDSNKPELPYTSKVQLSEGDIVPIRIFEDGKPVDTGRKGKVVKASVGKGDNGYYNYEVEEIKDEAKVVDVIKNNIDKKDEIIIDKKYELFENVFANEGQKIAIDKLLNFISSNNSNLEFLLEGKGGTGKTTIIKKILEKLPINKVLAIAPTHKAKKVLNKSINGNKNINKINVKTLASALAIKLDENTGKFSPDEYARKLNQVPIKHADYIIIDESSMISNDLLKEIKNWKKASAKIIYMGDKAQLPPVGQELDSDVFSLLNKYELTEKMRQAKNSPIIKIGSIIASNVEAKDEDRVLNPIKIDNRISIYDEISNTEIIWEKNEINALDSFINDLKQDPENTDNVKIITFNNQNHNSNQSVKNLNKKVREKLFGLESKNQFIKGELVTAYTSYSKNSEEEDIIKNADDFIIVNVREKTIEKSISAFSVSKGNRNFTYKYNIVELDLKNNDDNSVLESIPVIADSSKQKFVSDLNDLWKKDPQLAFILNSEFADIQPGYAITAHKSQGSTYKTVYVFEDNILGISNSGSYKAKNQAFYVAVSRPSKKLVIVSENNNNNEDNVCSSVSPI